MSDYTPQVGHRVRVTQVREGIVSSVDPGNRVCVDHGDGFSNVYSLTHPANAFERLSDPEPRWEKADVVRDGYGNTLIRRNPDAEFEWRNAHNEDVYRDSEVVRPLTPLVRDGKPWAEAVGGAS